MGTFSLLLAFLAIPLFSTDSTRPSLRDWDRPIILDRSGGFQIGGRIISNASQHTLSCDHGYMEYFIPWKPRRTSLVMCYTYEPTFLDQANFVNWKFGPRYPNWYPGGQFPTHDLHAWQQATSARYFEFDNYANIVLQARAASIAADSGKVADSIVYLTNSAGGLRAQLTAVLSNTTNIKAIVAYESFGFVFPDNINITADTQGGFGPVVSRLSAELINLYEGNAEVLMLALDASIKGNTHIPFADLGNRKTAALLEKVLKSAGLDGYARGRWRDWQP
ncbi:alpha/beta-hydrolase [Podospora australis]|uniref:Alpha/beta-hydrolase n=1 Tax=Podospora australis TaxID=1536484 RepID=A0AAN7AE79_9PEZI|nr:alpha/beta-hydrolase [Podospora australis]